MLFFPDRRSPTGMDSKTSGRDMMPTLRARCSTTVPFPPYPSGRIAWYSVLRKSCECVTNLFICSSSHQLYMERSDWKDRDPKRGVVVFTAVGCRPLYYRFTETLPLSGSVRPSVCGQACCCASLLRCCAPLLVLRLIPFQRHGLVLEHQGEGGGQRRHRQIALGQVRKASSACW